MEKDPIDSLLDDVQSGKTLIKDRDVLHFTYMPETVFHRDREQRTVTHSLSPILKQSRSSNLLIYGKTGTGKTLVVRKVLEKIEQRVKDTTYPIKLAYTNAKNEATLYGLLVSFGRQIGLTDHKTLPSTGLSISEIFNRILRHIESQGFNTLLVIDEIDYLAKLISKSGKDILYQLTRSNEWMKSGSLTLIGISNDLTFKDALDPRVISSLSEEEIVFPTYSVDQLKKILQDRIQKAFVEGGVSDSALSLCAAIAGKEHGDARRAIDVLRVAGELAERNSDDKVSEDHIRTASAKMEEEKETDALNSYPLHEKLLIIAIMKRNGGTTGEIYAAYKELCKNVRQKEVSQRRATQILSEIELTGLINGKIVHQGMHGRTKKFSLTIYPDTVKKAFRNDIMLEDII